jgi:hypothetical protein
MFFHQTVDENVKFSYSFIIIDPQIDEKHQISPQIHQFQRVRVKIWKFLALTSTLAYWIHS